MSLPGFFRIRTMVAMFVVLVTVVVMVSLYRKAGDMGGTPSASVSEPTVSERPQSPTLPPVSPAPYDPVPRTVTVVPGSAVLP